jgi:hypothetical protein
LLPCIIIIKLPKVRMLLYITITGHLVAYTYLQLRWYCKMLSY